MEEQLYAIADYVPDSSGDYLTPGKPYKILTWLNAPNSTDPKFEIVDDAGDQIPCVQNGCAHLHSGPWRIVKESDLTPKERKAAGLFGQQTAEDAAMAELRKRVEALEEETGLDQQYNEFRFRVITARLNRMERAQPHRGQESDPHPSYTEVYRRVRDALQTGCTVLIEMNDGSYERIDP